MTDSRFIVLGIPDKRPTIMGYRKGKSIILEVLSDPPYARGISFEFTKHEYFVFYRQLLGMAQEIWPDLVLKEITGAGNDYGEYYDRELDNDGSASIGAEGISFWPPAPHLESNRLYRFTKSKIQTYLFDLKKYADLKV